MESLLDQPVFVFTSDVDWASEPAIEDSIRFYDDLGIELHVFATHESAVLQGYQRDKPGNVGMHPNFLPGSTQGDDPKSIVGTLMDLYPGLRSSRSHHFYDTSEVVSLLSREGIQYDSNLCLWLEPELRPLQLGAGEHPRYPVFWEDDVHWTRFEEFAPFSRLADRFFTPGLKILNTHPFSLFLNIGDGSEYNEKKQHTNTVDDSMLDELRNPGYGTRSFIQDLVAEVRRRDAPIMTLDSVHQHLFETDHTRESSAGRNSSHSKVQFESYLKADDATKQEFVRRSYEQRNAWDIYATSRDYHLRELEIEAIRTSFPEGTGRVLDLGCGNGYTILSLAKGIPGREFTGVDFSENLIEGANHLKGEWSEALRSEVEFHCGDALAYIAEAGNATIEVILTERFVLNLPSRKSQLEFLRQCQRVLSPNGTLLMCEGFQEGFDRLNKVRSVMGLSEIPDKAADNVSSLKLGRSEIRAFLEESKDLELEDTRGFSEYFAISRVLHPLLVAPARPSYDSKINGLARRIQAATDFRPGLGSNELWVIRKSS